MLLAWRLSDVLLLLISAVIVALRGFQRSSKAVWGLLHRVAVSTTTVSSLVLVLVLVLVMVVRVWLAGDRLAQQSADLPR